MSKKDISPYHRQMGEDVFQAHVIQCAVENGFVLPPVDPNSKKITRRRRFLMVFHPYDSRKSVGIGYPDLTLVHPETGRTIFAELKKEGAYPSPEQRRWLEALRKNPGVEVYVWKPSMMDEVREVLGGYDPRLVA